MSMCVGFLDAKKQIREECVDVERITGEVLFEVVNLKKRNYLHLEDLRSQCYDGASNMSAVKKGLSGRVLEVNPQALYTHCTSHVLNLSTTAACKKKHNTNGLNANGKLGSIFKILFKKRDIVGACCRNRDLRSQHQPAKLVGLCKTHWAERDKAYEHFYLEFPFIVKALEIINRTCQDAELYPESFITGWEPVAKNNATSHLHALCNFGTIIGVVTLYRLFHPLATITKCLKKKAVDIVNASKDIEAVKGDFHAVRCGLVKEFSKIYDQAEHLGSISD